MAGQKGKNRFDALMKGARFSEVPALAEFLGKIGDPLSSTAVSKLMREFDQVRLHSLERITDRLERRPTERLIYIVVDTSVHRDVFAADENAESDLRAVERVVKNRFPHAQALLLLETDAVPISTQSSGTLADARWMQKFAPNAVVWKNQINIIAYIPFAPAYDDFIGRGARPELQHAVEAAFRTRADGKRSRFAGGNQVRAQRVRVATKNKRAVNKYAATYRDYKVINPRWKSDEPELLPDVRKVVSYSLKGHYRAPDPSAPMTGLIDWIWITCRHLTIRSRRKEVGFRGDPMMYCSRCKDFFKLDGDDPHRCPLPYSVDEEFYGQGWTKKLRVFGQAPLIEWARVETFTLTPSSAADPKLTNSPLLNAWKTTPDVIRVVFAGVINRFHRLVVWVAGTLTKARPPPPGTV